MDERIEDHETRIRKLEEDNFRRDEREKSIFLELGEIKSDIKAILGQPSKRWETLIAALISCGAAGLIGYFLGK